MSKLGGFLIFAFILYFILRGMMPPRVRRPQGPHAGPDPGGPDPRGPAGTGYPPGDVIDVEVIEKDSK